MLAATLLVALAWAYPSGTRGGIALAGEWLAMLVRVFQLHIGLAVALLAIIALVRRRWLIAASAVPIVAFTLAPIAWTLVARDESDATRDRGTTRIMTANLLASNDDHAATFRGIRRVDPDIVVLQEYTETWDRALHADLPGYRRIDDPASSASFGVAVLVRAEGDVSPTGPPDDRKTTTRPRSVVEISGRDVALYNTHLFPPSRPSRMKVASDKLGDVVQHVDDERLPVVVAGDFNFTDTTAHHQSLRRAGLRDAWDMRGRGLGATWPDGGFLVGIPGLRLDHVYVSDELEVVGAFTVDGNGSDHRALVVDLRS